MSLRAAYWAAFAAASGVYLTMVLWTLPGIAQAAGGLIAFDLRPMGYGPDEARSFLSALSDEGRALYQGPQRLLDMAYPVLLAVVLGGAVWSLVNHRIFRLILLGLVIGGMLADYTENILVAGLLDHPGPVTDADVSAASRATIAKSAMTGLAMGSVLAALIITGIRRRYRR